MKRASATAEVAAAALAAVAAVAPAVEAVVVMAAVEAEVAVAGAVAEAAEAAVEAADAAGRPFCNPRVRAEKETRNDGRAFQALPIVFCGGPQWTLTDVSIQWSAHVITIASSLARDHILDVIP